MTAIKFKNGDNWEHIALSCYPVGSVYMSENSTSPATIFGGTWVALEDRMLIGASGTYNAGSTGGSSTTTLVTANLPAHAHIVPEHGHGFTQPTVNGGAITNGITGGSHSHGLKLKTNGSIGNNAWIPTDAKGYTNSAKEINSSTHSHNLPAHTHSVSGGSVTNAAAFNTQNTGSGAVFDTISPYYAVYMWKRTA